MRSLLQLLGSKVALAILGALLVGGVSAVVAAGTVAQHPGAAPLVSASISPTATGAAAMATNNPQATTQSSQPTATPTTQATPSPTPTGQTVTLRGTITAINSGANSFTLRTRTGSQTVVVDGATTYQGSSAQFSDLRVNWVATVTVQQQPDGTYLASVVSASPGDN